MSINIQELSLKSTQTERVDGRWTNEEHELFLEGLKIHGKNWKRIQKIVKTRTGSQIRSHAQKFFCKLSQQKKRDSSEESSQASDLKGDLSSSTMGIQNQSEYSCPSIQGMLLELKNTLSLIEQSNINPLDTYSYFFFEIIKQPEQILNDNFYGYFVDMPTPTTQQNKESWNLSKKISFQPYIHHEELSSCLVMQSN